MASNTCAECGSPAKFRCAQCCIMYYCSQKCQKTNWKQHKPGCISIIDIWKCMDRSVNPLIKYFGLDVMCKLSRRIADIGRDGPIISIGSGQGIIEGFMSYMTGVDIICIDPNPSSYQKIPEQDLTHSRAASVVGIMRKLPLFRNIKHYIDSGEELQNITLIINWPSPGQIVPWDINAIKVLKPKNIVVLFDMFGVAGSYELTTWLSTFDEIYTPIEREIHKSLNISNTSKHSDDTYYVNEFIKGHTCDYIDNNVKIPDNFINLSRTEKHKLSVRMKLSSYTYAIAILSKTRRTPTIQADPSKFTKTQISDNNLKELTKMKMMYDKT